MFSLTNDAIRSLGSARIHTHSLFVIINIVFIISISLLVLASSVVQHYVFTGLLLNDSLHFSLSTGTEIALHSYYFCHHHHDPSSCLPHQFLSYFFDIFSFLFISVHYRDMYGFLFGNVSCLEICKHFLRVSFSISSLLIILLVLKKNMLAHAFSHASLSRSYMPPSLLA